MIDEIKLIAAYMTVHGKSKDDCCAIGHSVMNKMMSSINGQVTDLMPAMPEERKERFLKIISGNMKREDEILFKKNLIYAAAVMNGKIDDMTEGADSFSSKKVAGSKKIGDLYFSKSQTESVISETSPKPGRKKRKSNGY